MIVQALVLAGAAALAACVDGYPTEDAVLLDETAMRVPQLIATLNGVGRRPHLAADYRYAMADDCVLHVASGARRAPATAHMALAGADIQIRTSGGAEDWQVQLRPPGDAHAPAVLLLQGGKWADAVQVRSLVQHLQRRCAGTAARAVAQERTGPPS